jgi:hypothetical protein
LAHQTASPAKSARTFRSHAPGPTAIARAIRAVDRGALQQPRGYVGKFAAAAVELVKQRYLLDEDVVDLLQHAVEHFDWAAGKK